jgi:polar amino acid transport system substrate-binding protein
MKLLPGFLLSLLLATSAQAADKVIVGAEDDWYPYSGTVNAKPKGMAVDIVRRAFEKAGVEVQLQSMPYARCMEDAKAGRIFGCFDAARNSVLEPSYLWHAKPLFLARINIYAAKDATDKGMTVKSLEGKNVAVTQDYEYGEAFDTNTKISRTVSKHDVQGFRLVQKGKVQYMVAYEKVANHLFSQYKDELAGQFKVVGNVAEVGLYMAVAKSAPDAARILQKFEQGMEAIIKDGSYKEIENTWK